MHITRLETFTVVVPLHPGAWHSVNIDHAGDSWEHGRWPERPLVLLRLHTDDGLTGLGEVARGVTASEVEEAVASLIGRDLFSINLQSLALEMTWFAHPSVAEGVEMALYDLMGKALGVPVYRLFGGKFRDRVPVSRCSGRMTPADAAQTAREAVEQGYSVLKMKARADDPVIERLTAIHEAVGDQIRVNIDPNERFQQPFRLFDLWTRMERAGIANVECFESPFNQRNLDWYVLARQKIDIPIALHLVNAADIFAALKREACDWLNIGGTMVNVYKLAGLAEAAGIPTWHGSGVGLGVSEAAYVHICAACQSMTLTSDICGETLRVNDLIVEPLIFAAGHVLVPEAPGLGVELDMNAVERYGVR